MSSGEPVGGVTLLGGAGGLASHRLRILHLSDLHEAVFEPWMVAFDPLREGKISSKAADRNVVIEKLCTVLGNIKEQQPPHLVCFTGDVADWGVKAEYEQATQTLSRLLAAVGTTWERLLVVPGNHDVQRAIAASEWEEIRWHPHPADISKWMCNAGKAPAGMDDGWRDDVLYRERRFWDWVGERGLSDLVPTSQGGRHPRLGYRVQRDIGGLPFPVWVVGLDSAWLAGDDHDAGKLRLTPQQVSMLTSDAKGEGLRGFRIALLHHPLGDLADQLKVRTRLTSHMDLVLHGHQHKPVAQDHVDPGDRTLRVIAAGSLFEGDEGKDWVNSFQVIDVDLDDTGAPHRYELTSYGWSPDGEFWHRSNAMYPSANDGRIVWSVAPRGKAAAAAEIAAAASTATAAGSVNDREDEAEPPSPPPPELIEELREKIDKLLALTPDNKRKKLERFFASVRPPEETVPELCSAVGKIVPIGEGIPFGAERQRFLAAAAEVWLVISRCGLVGTALCTGGDNETPGNREVETSILAEFLMAAWQERELRVKSGERGVVGKEQAFDCDPMLEQGPELEDWLRCFEAKLWEYFFPDTTYSDSGRRTLYAKLDAQLKMDRQVYALIPKDGGHVPWEAIQQRLPLVKFLVRTEPDTTKKLPFDQHTLAALYEELLSLTTPTPSHPKTP